jgi:hypothetical protein
MPNITNIPAPRVPFIDERTGLVAREWYRFLFNQFNLTGGGETSITLSDLELAPFSDAATEAEVQVLASDVEALKLRPPLVLPEPYTPYYGSFYSDATQTAAAINTAYGATFSATDLTYGVYLGSPASRVICANPGVYDFQFSAQFDNTSGGSHFVYIWPRVDGVDIPNSASQVRLQGNNNELIAAWNFVLKMKAGGYFELMWSVSDVAVQMIAVAASSPVPAIPSILLSVTQVNL